MNHPIGYDRETRNGQEEGFMGSRRQCCSSTGVVVAIAGLAAGCGGDDTPADGAANQGDIADLGGIGDLGDMEGVEGVEGLGEALDEYEDIMEDLDMEAIMEDPEAAGDQIMASFVDEGAWATVTVGDEQYDFDQLYCVTIGGAVGVQDMGGRLRPQHRHPARRLGDLGRRRVGSAAHPHRQGR